MRTPALMNSASLVKAISVPSRSCNSPLVMNSDDTSSPGIAYDVLDKAATDPNGFFDSWDSAWKNHKRAIVIFFGGLATLMTAVLGMGVYAHAKEKTFEDHTRDVVKKVLVNHMKGKFQLNKAEINSLVSNSYDTDGLLKGSPDWKFYVSRPEEYKKDLEKHLIDKLSNKQKGRLYLRATGNFVEDESGKSIY
ncbi:MAG: hypothetical protein QNJ31_09350 [Candidatus Caenarcaniphilales bacterium]|nr:hypothetical protein [Candidatus Caenarcaniphilales bacterium]